MKRFCLPLIVAACTLCALYLLFNRSLPAAENRKSLSKNSNKEIRKPEVSLMAMQADYQFMKLKDPKTGMIPLGIRSRELSYTSKLPKYPEGGDQSWTWRGPTNIGGRMLCIAVDVDDDDHLLAGSASGGMWESADRGQNWHKTTSPDAEQSATCLVQDKRPGKHNIWYYGTGELLSRQRNLQIDRQRGNMAAAGCYTGRIVCQPERDFSRDLADRYRPGENG
ncbi:MAG: hypothetical protein ABSE72_00560 [Bacteroidales bacterium]